MTDRCILVTGASRGIGRAIALRLAHDGFDIAVHCRSRRDLAEAVAAEIEALGRKARVLEFDAADRAGCATAIDTDIAAHGAYHGVVCNAGIARDNLLAFMRDEEWDAVLRTNLDGFFNVTKPVIFEMIRKKRGRIVVISSVSGQMGQAGQVNYAASKAGLIGAARALAREVGRKNVFVNVVSPGVIDTEMTAELPKEHVLPLIPLNRFGTSEEVAAVEDFLCSEPRMYVHGQVIGVNGGMAI